MKVARSFSIKVLYVLDQWVPPIVRDSKWFMGPLMKFVLRRNSHDFMTFKDWVFKSTDKEFGDLYERTALPAELQGETDLNDACLQAILKRVKNRKVLEVGCGRGLLADKLSLKNKVTGCDIVINDAAKKRFPAVKFVAGNIEHLPFKDNSFEVVVTTHTLEHVKHLEASVAELRRVAKNELIIVVPKQRPYKYTFSLHTQFFPYEWSLQAAFGYEKGKTTIKNLDGDWFYVQKLS